MEKVKFIYNHKTLRYERASISVFVFAFKFLGYLLFASIFFVVLVMIVNLFVNTPLEKKLRAENNALRNHKEVLIASLQKSNERIQYLDEQDQNLYEQIFEAKKTIIPDQSYSKEEILAAEPQQFANWQNNTTEQLDNALNKAVQNNYLFSEKAQLSKADFSVLNTLPSLPPVKGFEIAKLVSGFGKRINPFHKGLYQHDGVDIAMPSGTEVIAPSAGTVTVLKRSNLMAGFGNYIEINHGNNIITRYAHLGELKVRPNQKVAKGQPIAIIGLTGGSIVPHLHYEVIKNGINVNPIHYIINGLNSTQYHWLVKNSMKENQSLD